MGLWDCNLKSNSWTISVGEYGPNTSLIFRESDILTDVENPFEDLLGGSKRGINDLPEKYEHQMDVCSVTSCLEIRLLIAIS